MSQAFVHVGGQKTASSFVQTNLKLHRDRLMEKHGLQRETIMITSNGA